MQAEGNDHDQKETAKKDVENKKALS